MMGQKENPLVTLEQMDEVWADIRGYTSNMWQVAALCLTVVTLSINVFVSSLGSELTLFSYAWIPVISFSFCFVIITIYTIQWFRLATVQRVVFLLKIEEKLKKSAPDSLVPLRSLYGVDWGPLRVLLVFFYGLAVSLLIVIEAGLLSMALTFHPAVYIVAILVFLFSVVAVFLPLYRHYNGILRREEDAWTLSDVAVFDWTGAHFLVLKDIAVFIIGLLKETVRGKRINYMIRTQEYIESAHGAKLSTSTVTQLYLKDGPIFALGLDPRANEWRKRKNREKALEELDKIADRLSQLESMPK